MIRYKHIWSYISNNCGKIHATNVSNVYHIFDFEVTSSTPVACGSRLTAFLVFRAFILGSACAPSHRPLSQHWVGRLLVVFWGGKKAKKQRDGASQLETLSGAGESFILVCSNVQMSWKAATRASSSNCLCRNDCRRHQLTARQADRFYNCKSNSLACSKLDYAVSWQKHFRCVSFASYNRELFCLCMSMFWMMFALLSKSSKCQQKGVSRWKMVSAEMKISFWAPSPSFYDKESSPLWRIRFLCKCPQCCRSVWTRGHCRRVTDWPLLAHFPSLFPKVFADDDVEDGVDDTVEEGQVVKKLSANVYGCFQLTPTHHAGLYAL